MSRHMTAGEVSGLPTSRLDWLTGTICLLSWMASAETESSYSLNDDKNSAVHILVSHGIS